MADYFISFLHERGKKLQLMSYIGNRLNVQFYNGGAIYYHLNDIKSFLDGWPAPNNLLKAVKEDMESTVHLAELRALGIIDKLVTGPFWRVVNKVDNILQLNTSLFKIKECFEKWCVDASELMEGKPLFDEDDVPIHKDDVYEALFIPTEDPDFDSITQQALELLMHGLLLILERQAQDQLPGGKYWNPSKTEKTISSTVPATNMASERDFAHLDLLIRTKPNATTLSLEAVIMWQNNKTSAWLNEKSEEEKKKLMESARKGAADAHRRFNERRKTLKQKKLQKLKDKQKAKEEAAQKSQLQKVKVLAKLTKTGHLWTSVNEVDSELQKIPDEKDKKEAVLAQINVHRVVLHSKGEKHLFHQTQTLQGKKNTFDLPTLICHLKQIIRQNPGLSIDNGPQAESSSGSVSLATTRAFKVLETKTILRQKVAESRKKVTVKQQKNVLPSLLENPEQLVGRRVSHRVTEETSDVVLWCEGTVLEVIKISQKNPCKTVYLIHYDIEEENLNWKFPLLEDMQKGDLILLENV